MVLVLKLTKKINIQMEETTRVYTYTFAFPDRAAISFTVSLNSISHYINTCPMVPPEWCRLLSHQCEPCTLAADQNPFCPVALNIAELVTAFKDIVSYAPCNVSCSSLQRTVTKDSTVQEGLASILGLLMATSGCPVMDFFRPMARFHLPFSTVDESLFRIVSMYLLRQYYLQPTHGQKNPLRDIKSHYAQVKLVNAGMLKRILNISALDADKNAIVTLSSLAQILEMEVDTNLESLQNIFIDP